MVLPDGAAHLAALLTFFDDFALVSGLHLNIPKTVLVPLDPGADEAVRDALRTRAPGWGGVLVASSAKYLG
eukprot:7053080-Pyramimonas_sp.AAC.1